MGSFYTSITLRGPSQDRVIAALNERNRVAYVSPTLDGITLVCDKQSEDQDSHILKELTGALSRRLTCVALAVLNHDDDILMCWLYDKGILLDEYDSTPGYFEGDEDDPSGGDAAAFCRVFGAPDSVDDVDEILRSPQGDDADGYLFALDRHMDLMDALSLPQFIAGTGYRYIEEGEIYEIDPDEFAHVGDEE